jgi:hypothetical protein
MLKFLSSIGGAKWWLLAIAITAAASFAGGYQRATRLAEGILADRVLEAYDKGAAAQKRWDDAQHKKAMADYIRRTEANQKRDRVAEEIISQVPVLVPHNDACTISAEAMKALNEVIK